MIIDNYMYKHKIVVFGMRYVINELYIINIDENRLVTRRTLSNPGHSSQ